MNATPDQTVPTEQDTKPVRVAPVRPDGWPDWLGRRPMTTADRKTLRETIETGLPETVTTTGGPFLCLGCPQDGVEVVRSGQPSTCDRLTSAEVDQHLADGPRLHSILGCRDLIQGEAAHRQR
jgi:hypothetical protein